MTKIKCVEPIGSKVVDWFEVGAKINGRVIGAINDVSNGEISVPSMFTILSTEDEVMFEIVGCPVLVEYEEAE